MPDPVMNSASVIAPVVHVCLSWLVRLATDRRGVLIDCLAISLITGLRHRGSILDTAASQLPAGTLRTSFYLLVLSSVIFAASHAILDRSIWRKDKHAANREPSGLKPMLFPSRTTHTRLFPKVHSFSYSYLYAGIPIGWTGSAGTLLSADPMIGSKTVETRSVERTWFNVEGQDYLQRGHHPDGLAGKLKDYLRLQGVPEGRYTHAYLVTAPRFLGFSFNPVSFWYLYLDTQEIGAMILEVNNTFDERRMYFLEKADVESSTDTPAVPFKSHWAKDFHVSPFNSRDGSYSVTVTDPFAPRLKGVGKVDCNIVLYSDDGKPKIVARVFSINDPLVAETAGKITTLLFVLRWWWVGFMTNPRILREARRLWVKGVELFYRPEVVLGSIGRTDRHEERAIEAQFCTFLSTQANAQNQPITYISAAGANFGVVQPFSPAVNSNRTELRIEVLTPALYAEMARLGSMGRAIKQFGSVAEESARMIYVSDTRRCEEILDTALGGTLESRRHLGFSILGFCRALKATSKDCNFIGQLLAGWAGQFGAYLSDLDRFVLQQSSPSWAYVKASLVVLISDRIAFGFSALLRLYGTVIWLVACLLASRSLDVVLNIGDRPSGQFSWLDSFCVTAVNGLSLVYK